MTENLIQKLEDKIMTLVTEVDSMRKELYQLHQENSLLKSEKAMYMQKMQNLLSLMDSVDVSPASAVA